MIEKNKVRNNFSRNAATYDDYAVVQRYMGEKLLEFIDKKIYKKILEIGCGTGLFTKIFLETNNEAELTLLDISPDMIETVKKQISNKNVKYIAKFETFVFFY